MNAKLTAKQREVLQLMAGGEYVLLHAPGMGNFMHEYYSFDPRVPNRKWYEDMRTIRALEKRGLIHYGELRENRWSIREYNITDLGRAALAEDTTKHEVV